MTRESDEEIKARYESMKDLDNKSYTYDSDNEFRTLSLIIIPLIISGCGVCIMKLLCLV